MAGQIVPRDSVFNSGIFKRVAEGPGETPVQLIGECRFYQVQGGTISKRSRGTKGNGRVLQFMQDYAEIGDHHQLIQPKFVIY